MYEFGLVVRDRTHKPLELCVTISDTSPNPPMYVALNVAASGGASLEEMVQLADTIKDMAALGQHLKTILAEVLPMFDPVFTAASANSPDYIILDAACRTATSMVAAHNRMYREYQP
jgi:hypothetical protein